MTVMRVLLIYLGLQALDYAKMMVLHMDYGHTMVKSLIRIPIHNRYSDLKAYFFCRNNGMIVGKHVTSL